MCIFSSPVRLYMDGYCITPGVGIGVDGGVSGGVDVSKMFKFKLLFLCDAQSAVRQAILYRDRSCF